MPLQQKTERLNIRVTTEFMEHLNELCDTYGRNRTEVIEMLVFGEYLKTTEKGKEQVKKLNQGMNLVTQQLNEMLKGIKQ